MSSFRLIARLDVKGSNLIKGVHLEGLRVVGNPRERALRYYQDGADELIYMDAVASLYGRNNLSSIVEETARDVFIPMTVGGGIRSVDDAQALLRRGADKIAVNTAAVKRPELLTELSRRFGSQCVVLSIEAKSNGAGWEAYTDNGRERSGFDAVQWAQQGARLGAGEILVTSVDNEGTLNGFDASLIRAVADSVAIPVIASGGFGNGEHLSKVFHAGANAAAFAHVLHFDKMGLPAIRAAAAAAEIPVRTL